MKWLYVAKNRFIICEFCSHMLYNVCYFRVELLKLRKHLSHADSSAARKSLPQVGSRFHKRFAHNASLLFAPPPEYNFPRPLDRAHRLSIRMEESCDGSFPRSPSQRVRYSGRLPFSPKETSRQFENACQLVSEASYLSPPRGGRRPWWKNNASIKRVKVCARERSALTARAPDDAQ